MTEENVETETDDGEIVDAEVLEFIEPNLDLVPSEKYLPAKIEGGMAYFDEYLQLAEKIAKTAMVPNDLRGNGDQVLAVFMYGAELGMGPMQALNQINFIEGRPALKPEAMRALIRKAGHKLDISQSEIECVIVGTRADTGEEGEASFSIEDADRAELLMLNKETGAVRARSQNGKVLPWEKYTKDLLLARATSRIARLMFSDVIAGLSYAPEEIESFSERPVKPTKAAKKVREARKTTKRQAPTHEGDDAPQATTEQKVELATLLSELTDAQEEDLKARWMKMKPGLPPKRLLVTYDDHVRAIALVKSVAKSQVKSEGLNNADEVKPHPAPKGKLTQLNMRFDEAGFGDREVIHEYCAKVIKKPVTSTKDLTTAEINHIIDQLNSDAGQ